MKIILWIVFSFLMKTLTFWLVTHRDNSTYYCPYVQKLVAKQKVQILKCDLFIVKAYARRIGNCLWYNINGSCECLPHLFNWIRGMSTIQHLFYVQLCSAQLKPSCFYSLGLIRNNYEHPCLHYDPNLP